MVNFVLYFIIIKRNSQGHSNPSLIIKIIIGSKGGSPGKGKEERDKRQIQWLVSFKFLLAENDHHRECGSRQHKYIPDSINHRTKATAETQAVLYTGSRKSWILINGKRQGDRFRNVNKKKDNTAFLCSVQLWQGLGLFQRFKSNTALACHEVRIGMGSIRGSTCQQLPELHQNPFKHRKMNMYPKYSRNNTYNIQYWFALLQKIKKFVIYEIKKNHFKVFDSFKANICFSISVFNIYNTHSLIKI